MTSRAGLRPRRGEAHGAVLAAFIALGAAAGSWGSRIPDVKADLALTEGALGSALLGLSIGAVSGAWIGGLLVRRVGSRQVIRAGWLAVGLALFLPGLAGSWGALAAATLTLGLAIGVLDVSMNGAGVQLEHAAAEPLLSGLHAGWSFGVLVGAGTGAATVAIGLSTSVHLAGVGAVILVGALALAGAAPDGRIATPGLADPPDDVIHVAIDDAAHHSAADPAGGPAAPTSHRPARASRAGSTGLRLAALAAICGFVFLGEGALLDWAGVFVRDDLDGGALLGALAVTGLSLGGLIGRLAGDRMVLRWGAANLVRASVSLAVIGVGLMLVSPVAWPVPFLLVAVGIGFAPAVPLAFGAAGKRWGEHGIAVVTTAGYGAYLGGPALIGGLAHATTLRLALLVPLILAVGVLPLAWATDD